MRDSRPELHAQVDAILKKEVSNRTWYSLSDAKRIIAAIGVGA
jgi:hypothetical protein